MQYMLTITFCVLLAKEYLDPLCTHIQSTCLYYHIILFYILENVGDWDSSVGTGWTVRGPNPGWGRGGKIFRTCPYKPWGPSSVLNIESRVFPGGKTTGAQR
jgi:hypothetical protein